MGTVGPIQASMGHVPHPSLLTPDLSRWGPAGPASRFINTKGPQRLGASNYQGVSAPIAPDALAWSRPKGCPGMARRAKLSQLQALVEAHRPAPGPPLPLL